MSNAYKAQIETAARLIKKKGQAVVFYRLGDEVPYTPLTKTAGPRAVAHRWEGVAVNFPASNGTIEAFDNRILENPAQRRNFRFYMVAAKDLERAPDAGDIMKTAEGYVRLLGATPLNVNGSEPIFYNVGASMDVPDFLPDGALLPDESDPDRDYVLMIDD